MIANLCDLKLYASWENLGTVPLSNALPCTDEESPEACPLEQSNVSKTDQGKLNDIVVDIWVF